MQYTRLGRTGLTVSRICLGCMSYGDPKWRPWVLDAAAGAGHHLDAIADGHRRHETRTRRPHGGYRRSVTLTSIAEPGAQPRAHHAARFGGARLATGRGRNERGKDVAGNTHDSLGDAELGAQPGLE